MVMIMNDIKTKKITKAKVKQIFNTLIKDLFKTPFYVLTHPIKGFEMFKTEENPKKYVLITYLFLMCLVQVISYNGQGFLVNSNNPQKFNAIKIILFVLIPVALVTIGNWAFTTLFDGKGSVNEIFSVICYSLIPYIWISIPNLLYSNFLIIEELGFYQAFNYLGIILLGYMAFFGLLVIHEYGLLRSIISLVFTVVAIGIMIFVTFLILTIFQELYSLVISIYREFVMRYF